MRRLGWLFGRVFLTAARGTVLAIALLVSGAAFVTSVQHPDALASRSDDDDKPKVSPPQANGADGTIVRLDRDGQQKSGIETVIPVATPYQDLVRAYGTVLALDRLTGLYNTALMNEAQLKAAEAKMAASRAASERAQSLLKVFSTAKAQAETAAAAYEIDSVGVDAAKAQVEALRNTAIQDWGPVLGGAIAARDRFATDLVLRRTSLVQISLQPGTVVKPPVRLFFSLGTAPAIEGRLVSEASQLDPKIQSVGYLYEVPVTSGLLPGTSVLAYLPKGDTQPGVGIPSSAVVWQAGRPWMYLRTAPNAFERHPIDEAAAPTPDGGYVVPAKSLPRTEAIVVAGAQILLSQEMRAQIPADEDNN